MELEYKSVDHVLEEVKEMTVRGGSAFGRAAASAFLLVLEEEELLTRELLMARFKAIAAKLLAEKPTMATIHNVVTLVTEVIKEAKQSTDIQEIKTGIAILAEKMIKHSYYALEQLGRFGANMVTDNDLIMIHSYSGALMSIFRYAVLQGKKFEVICTESRPLREGRYSARILEDLGVAVTFITDAAMWEFVQEADWVLVGADAITYDGTVANKMGTAMLSWLCEITQTPFFVASEIFKYNPLTRNGYQIELEKRPRQEVIEAADFETMNHIKVVNQFFDLTPPSNIRGFITEMGIILPAMLNNVWIELENNLKGRE
ncbi:MAG: S-methyl-5-thioribose-1-phosphate isomerase [Halanaerobiales bacterium]|nr:S-methyl-5-thioribose-1-phosphate isomerase [Halanaerobiales bacterium]